MRVYAPAHSDGEAEAIKLHQDAEHIASGCSKLSAMRTTVTLADDVAAAIELLRRERGLGMSEAINELVRSGLVKQQQKRSAFRQETHDMGSGIDYSNIGEALETLDGPSSR